MNSTFISAIRAAFDTDDQGILDALWLAHRMPPRTPSRAANAAPTDRSAVGEQQEESSAQEPKGTPRELAVPKVALRATNSMPGGSLYAGALQVGVDEPFVPVRPVRIPAGAALPNGLDIVRGFRGLPRRALSRIRLELDEDATVEATAQNHMKMMPVMRPQQERWFEAALVVEHTPSMEIWSQTVIEIERMLQYTGSFRDVRTYWLFTQPTARLVQQSGAESRIESLRDPQARRIVFFFGAGASESGSDGTLGKTLNCWATSTPVVMVHALPQRLWKNTNLGEPVILVDNPTLGGPNSQLHRQQAWWARRRVFDGERCVLPVFSLDRAAAQRWAEMIVSRRRITAPAFLVRTTPAPPVPAPPPLPPLTARERVSQFRGNCSQEAFRLAVHLAVGPFTLAVVQLVQSSIFGAAAQHSQVAEVILSGLVDRETPVGARVPPDQVVFRFDADAQAVLLESLRDDDARSLAQLMENYILQQRGRPDDLLVRVPDPEGKERVPASAEPFARLKKSLLERLGLTSGIVPVIVPSREESAQVTAVRPVWRIQQPLAGVGILWVDDRPANNRNESEELTRMGASVVPRINTREGLDELRRRHYDVIVTDMARGEEREAGLDFLRSLGAEGVSTPTIIYAAQWVASPGAQERAKSAGAFGCTNRSDILLDLILSACNRSDWTERYLDLMGQIGFDDTDALAVIRLSPEAIADALALRAPDVEQLYRALTIAVDAITGCDYVQLFQGETTLKLAADHIGSGKTRYDEANAAGVIGTAHRDAKTRWLPNVLSSRNYIPAEKSTKSELAIPVLTDRRRSSGVLNLESAKTNAFSAEPLRWLEALLAAYPLPRWTPRVFLIGSSLEEADASNIEHTLRRDGLEVAREGRGFLERIRGVWPFTSDRDSVESAFDGSNCYVVLVSPRTVSSAAFRRSVETALARQGSAPERIVVIPALIKPCELPKALRTLQVFDMTAGGTDGARRLLAELQMLRLHPSWRPNPVEAEVPAEVPSNPVADVVRRALAAHANDEDDEAIALFTDAIKSEPRGSTYFHRGEAYWYSHRYAEALQDFSAALRMDRSLELKLRFTRGQALADAGQYSDAIQDLDWVITKEPSFRSIAYAYRGRAVARAGLGQMADAEEDFQRSMSLAPDNAWLYYSMARVREAESPSDWHVFYYFAQSLRRRDPRLNRLNVLDAVASIERVTGKLPMSGRDIARSLDGPDKAILQRVAKDMESGEYGLALLRAETLRALRLDESTIEQHEAAVMRCVCHRRLGNFDLANREIDILSTLGTPPSGAFAERGYAQLRAGDIEGANGSFTMVGTTAEGLCGLALVSLRQGNLIEAEKMIQSALAFAPHNAEYLVTGARILEAAGLYANAETAYNESLQAKDPPLSIWEKSQVLEALGRLSGGTPAP